MKNAEISARKNDAISRGVGMTTQIYADKAENSEIWDVEGNRLIDFNMGYGPHIFGYADRDVLDEVADQFRNGHMTGLPHVLDADAGRLISELVPGIEQVRFANSGTARPFVKRWPTARWTPS